MAFKLENISKTQTVSKKKQESSSFLKKEIMLFGSSFSNKIKEDFYAELSVLLKAGIPLKEALDLIENSQKKAQNKTILQSISNSIVQGKSLSDELKTHKEFSDYEYYSVKIGEETGTLATVVEQLSQFFARKNEQKRQLVGVLTYPIIIMSTAVLVLAFMLQYVVPMFEDIFRQQKVELPAITRFIVKASAFFKSYSWLLLVSIALLLVFRKLLNKNKRYKEAKDQVVLNIPFIGQFVRTVYLSQFTQAVSLLTASKVPVLNSIQLVKEMIDFFPLKNALESVEKNILTGKSLSESLSEHSFFDDKMIAMVKAAEETNQNEFIFERLNSQYNTQVQQRSKLLSTALEPFIILFVGVIVGVILVAMYLPMFKLSSVLG